MILTPLVAIYWLWAVWAITWTLAGAWAARPAKRMPRREERPHLIVTFTGIALLFFFRGGPVLWTPSAGAGWALAGLATLSFAFCWWARLTMGRLWAPLVSRTAEHRLVATGPFAVVRHPIYAGLCGAVIAVALAQGLATSLVGAALAIVGFTMKGALEERFLRQELGAEAYDAYARRTPMLIPFWPR